jgi:hypothetical protein
MTQPFLWDEELSLDDINEVLGWLTGIKTTRELVAELNLEVLKNNY